jgi:hypothetical protein
MNHKLCIRTIGAIDFDLLVRRITHYRWYLAGRYDDKQHIGADLEGKDSRYQRRHPSYNKDTGDDSIDRENQEVLLVEGFMPEV